MEGVAVEDNATVGERQSQSALSDETGRFHSVVDTDMRGMEEGVGTNEDPVAAEHLHEPTQEHARRCTSTGGIDLLEREQRAASVEIPTAPEIRGEPAPQQRARRRVLRLPSLASLRSSPRHDPYRRRRAYAGSSPRNYAFRQSIKDVRPAPRAPEGTCATLPQFAFVSQQVVGSHFGPWRAVVSAPGVVCALAVANGVCFP